VQAVATRNPTDFGEIPALPNPERAGGQQRRGILRGVPAFKLVDQIADYE